ncbi:MAG: sterol desaturase family protein [Oligoflexia bacterium]|nr:sterol desaturase family protein [Oligoflexia bacterium]
MKNSFIYFLFIALSYSVLAVYLSWPKIFIILPLIVVTVGFNLFVESKIPFHQNAPARPVGRDFSFSLFNIFITAGIGDLLVVYLLALFTTHFFSDKVLFSSSVLGPLWLQAVVALLLNEFIRYWIHFAQHKIPILWKFHSIHHSVKEIYSLNTFYSHPFDYFLRNAIAFPFILMLGFDPNAVLLAATFVTVGGVFSHSRANFNFQYLNYVFSTNHLHRWHHSTIAAEADKNFGVATSIWDLVFGTFYLPKDRPAPEQTGLQDDHPYTPTQFFEVVLYPLIRKKR